MNPRSPIVALEDAIGTQLLLAQLGSGPGPMVASRYEIIELRGRGANGLVCRARDTRLNRQVALKLYPPLDDARLQQETLREAQALAQLVHPNVVGIYDHDQGVVVAGEVRLRCLFVSMEFIEGRHLKAWLAESQRSTNEILRALIAAGHGLLAAHRKGLVHRDFKPENVMIDVNDKVRVVDFGLARGQGYEFAESGPDPHSVGNLISARITQAGVAPGTPEYMAPEALSGQASASSDQFSFATAAWEALTGQLPGRMSSEPLSESRTAADPLSKLNKQLRAALERALSSNPEQRYPTLAELLDELRRVAHLKRRWVINGIVTFAASVLLAGGLKWCNDREQIAAISEAREDADAAAAQCADLAGKWFYDTVVIWASDNVRWHGATGHYELELVPLDGCSLNARLRKTGDGPRRYAEHLVREGAGGVRIVPTSAGLEFSSNFPIASDKFGKLDYEFNFVFAEDRLTGDFRYVGTDGVIWTGLLRGGRTPSNVTLTPDARLGSCISQCRIRCPSAASREACISERCSSNDNAIHECGRPEPELPPPPLAQQLLGSSARTLRAELDDEQGRKRCTAAAQMLAGRWRVSTPTTIQSWTVSARGCELEVGVRENEAALAPMRGLTTATGAWVLLDPARGQVASALVGWDPAFGATSDGQPLVAHRDHAH